VTLAGSEESRESIEEEEEEGQARFTNGAEKGKEGRKVCSSKTPLLVHQILQTLC